MLWQLDSVCFGKWELVVRLGMVTRHWDGQLGNYDAVHCGEKWICLLQNAHTQLAV